MPVSTQIQTNLTSGEVDPLLKMRVDINHYLNGAEKLRNVQVMPQGGVKRRPGLEYLATSAVDDVVDTIRFIEFVFSFTESFLLVVRTDGSTNTAVDIYDDGVLVDTLTNGADSIPWGHSDIVDLKWTQYLDTLIIFHPDHEPYQIKRISSVWSGEDVAFLNIPTFDFDDGGGDIVAGVDMVIQIVFFDAAVLGHKYTFLLDGIETEEITYGASAAASAVLIQTALRDLKITSATGIDVTHNVADSVGRVAFDVTFGGDDGERDWDLQPGYVHVGTDDLVETVIETQGEEPGAPVWSTARGWPRSGAFFQNRLCIAGSKSRPDTFWASRTNDPFNFDTSRDLADYAIDLTSSAEVVSTFKDIYAGRHLVIFAERSIWFVPISRVEPLIPENASLVKTSSRGISSAVRPKEADGMIQYLDNSESGLYGLLFTDVEDAYSSQSLSVVSSHLLNSPVSIALRKSQANDEADFSFIPNSDGSMAVFCSLREQEVAAWTLWETEGDFRETAVVSTRVYVAVKRTIDSVDKMFIERFDEDLTLDAAKGLFTGVSSVTVTSDISHLQGESVDITVDDKVEPAQTLVSPATTLTLDNTAEDYWQAGLSFPIVDGASAETWIKTLPPEFPDGRGATLLTKKRILEAKARVLNTNEMYINDNFVSFQDMDDDILDVGISKFTGDKVVSSLLGYSESPALEVTQREALYQTLLGLAYKVSG